MIAWFVAVALADGSMAPSAQRLVLSGPASAPPGAMVELELRGAWSGEAVLLTAPSTGARVTRPKALGGAVLELAQPMGVAATAAHSGGVTKLRVRAPAAGSAAWQVVLVVGPARLSSNPVTVVAGPAVTVVAGPAAAVGASAEVGATAVPFVVPTARMEGAPVAPSDGEPVVAPVVAPAVSPTGRVRVGSDTGDTAPP